jgi:polyhydroxyalkanoate synthesis regulator phasin
VKTTEPPDRILEKIRAQAFEKYKIEAVVENYMIAIEKIINSSDLSDDFLEIVKYGKLASVQGELDGYQSQAMTDDGFLELQTSGIASKTETRNNFIKRINDIKNTAEDMDRLYTAVRDKYEDVYTKEGVKKYSDESMDKLVYAASKIKDYDSRIPGVNEKLLNAGINAQSIIDQVVKTGELSEDIVKPLVEEIKSLGETDDGIEDSLVNLRHLSELALRRKKFINDFQNDNYLNEVRAQAWMEAMQNLRDEMGIE